MGMAFMTVITVSIIVSVNSEWNWCSDEASCKIDGKLVKNTMCSMNQSTENENYKHIIKATIPKFRAAMLSWHNTYRDKIASGAIKGWPEAANMRQMTWDNDLETVALRFSFQTRSGHDDCRRTEKYKEVGQNCAMNWNLPVGSEMPFPNMSFVAWVDEILLVTADKVVDKFQLDGSWGHFSAIVWADTYKIGCATTTFWPKTTQSGTTDVKYMQGRHVACNLYPMGNDDTKPTYKRGKPCSACPAGTACNPNSTHPNLCALPGDPASEIVEFIGKLPNGRGMKNTVDYYIPSILLLISICCLF